jgi:hypothetical protein
MHDVFICPVTEKGMLTKPGKILTKIKDADKLD